GGISSGRPLVREPSKADDEATLSKRGYGDARAGDTPAAAGLGRRPGHRACPGVGLPLPLAQRRTGHPAGPAVPAGALRLVQPALVDRAAGRAAGRGGTVAGPPGRPPAAAAGAGPAAAGADLRGG